jgi:glycosyltransferase involved in cell wall biosynthesis
MRILIAHNVSRHRPGGMMRIMDFLHRPLAAAGHQVDFLCSEDVVRGARGRASRFAFPWLVRDWAVRAARAGAPYDIVNVHEPHSALVTTVRGGTGNPAVVVTTHGVEQRAWELALEERQLGRAGPALGSRVWYPLSSLWQSRVGLTHADAVFCLNFEDRDYLARVIGVELERIVRIFPGAEPVFAAAARERSYATATRLVFAGTWRKNKGIEDLVPAFTELARSRHDLALTVLGAGVADGAVQGAFPPELRSRVVVVSTRTDDETAHVLAGCDIFVLPSLFEGTPLTLMEAMASGLPIVTTETCGMRDVVRHDENGLLIPIRSPAAIVTAVTQLLDDPARRERLGRAAQAEATSQYTWETVARTVSETYERLAAARAE